MNVNVGDRVQIKNGGIDVTNGNKARSGRYYGQGGPLWCTVESIDKNWKTGGKWGLPTTVTKVRCSNNGIVVWQVQLKDIADNVIKASEPETVQKKNVKEEKKSNSVTKPKVEAKITEVENSEKPKVVATITEINTTNDIIQTTVSSLSSYAIKKNSNIWQPDNQISTSSQTTGIILPASSKHYDNYDETIIGYNYMDEGKGPYISYDNIKASKKNVGSKNVKLGYWEFDSKDDEWDYIKNPIQKSHSSTAWQNSRKRRQMLNEDYENIQNSSDFPYYSKSSTPTNKDSYADITAKYDYRIIPGDPRYKRSQSLEDKLKEVRASFGIHVHGNNNIARAVKYYMYNRFKSPDTNLLHNKSVTYVFFTRPDLNLLLFNDTDGNCQATQQVLNHSESSMILRRYPELFKLLTDSSRCNDDNNFNFLLSNQVTSFDFIDETLSTTDVGKSWNEHNMVYGDSYTGKTAGEFSCNFTETSDYSIITLMKLWITYIDNVSNGAWSPSYSLHSKNPKHKPSKQMNMSHVYTKTLDYASSAYVFKCGPDGEDILYWTKYYGIFPTNTGVSALSWDNDTAIGSSQKLNIKFKYCFKRDLSPISLIEFNHNANMSLVSDGIYENSFNVNYAHSSRPFVGCPFVELKLAEPKMRSNGVNYESEITQIRLKFKPTGDSKLTDDLLYRYNMSGRIDWNKIINEE